MASFEWDSGNLLHIARHRVLPLEAEECVLNNPFDIGTEDSEGEERFAQLGETQQGRILIVIATMRSDTIRVVTAYDASPRWRKYYLDRRAECYD